MVDDELDELFGREKVPEPTPVLPSAPSPAVEDGDAATTAVVDVLVEDLVDGDAGTGDARFRSLVLVALGLLTVLSVVNLALLIKFLPNTQAVAATELAVPDSILDETDMVPDMPDVPDVQPEPAPVPAPAVVSKPRPAAAQPSSPPPPKPEPPPPSSSLSVTVKGASVAEGGIDAIVYVDNKRVGDAPVASFPVQPGLRTIRVDCQFEGKSYPGKPHVMDIPPNTEARLEHTCDVWVLGK